jgi:3D (Asp-Asp-Asp) domain-containing protein
MRRFLRGTAGVAIIISLLSCNPEVANNITEPHIYEEIKEPTYRERIEQMASRGEIRTITVEMTAYCPCEVCCGKTDGITATGVRAEVGMVAVDPNVLRLGSKIYANGHGVMVAADVGGAIKGNRIDKFMNTHEEALKFGRQMVKIYIL